MPPKWNKEEVISCISCTLIKFHLIIPIFYSCRKSHAKKGKAGRPPGGSKRQKGNEAAAHEDPAEAPAHEDPAQTVPINNSPRPLTRR